MFYLWNDVFKDEEETIFINKITYQDLFPISEKGVENIKEILDFIEVPYTTRKEDSSSDDETQK